jgi:ketosteroid isomerase-like protein
MKNRKVITWAAVSICLLLVPQAWSQGGNPRAPSGGTAEQQIKTLEAQRIEAILKSDTSFVEKYFADDYMAIRGDGKLTTKAQEIENSKSGTTKYASIDEHELNIRIYGDTAIANARSSIKATINGKPYSGDVRNTRVWVKDKGNWKLVAFQATRVAAEQAIESKGATGAQLVGTWTLVSETAHQGDRTTQPLGPNPLGSIMFDRGGRFMLLIARPELPKFAAGKRDAGTPEENKAVLAGLLAFFGTYSVSEADQALILRPEAGTFPNWNGADQKRFFTLPGDQMIWINRTPAILAEVVEVVWRRAP